MSTPKIKKGLGRGLNALFQDDEDSFESENTAPRTRPQAAAVEAHPALAQTQSTGAPSHPSRLMINVAQLTPGAFQPRQTFDEEALNQLADSFRGLAQGDAELDERLCSIRRA